MNIAFFGSSLVSAYWNDAATYYRGIIRALASLGYSITFFEPDANDRQKYRDIEDPEWAKVVVYPLTEIGLYWAIKQAAAADVVIKASRVGVFDDLLEQEILYLRRPSTRVIYWDADAPATLERIYANQEDPLRRHITEYDLILTYGGGDQVVDAFLSMGARQCVPVYNALDTATHFPVKPERRFEVDLAFIGNRLPDRESRVDEFFLKPAASLPSKNFLLGGSGWEDKPLSSNINYLGHVYAPDHNTINCSATAVLNINRDSMARFGFTPPTRIFEAAGAGACLISNAWEGMEYFLEPDVEVLVAESGKEVVRILKELTPDKAALIGRAALDRVLHEHTYDHRALQLDEVLKSMRSRIRKGAVI
ncbi:MAG: glycosyltransferase [Desulfobulbaceae bacterium]|nr:glycosyltransferase [Desulfobulbaceae bacterium]